MSATLGQLGFRVFDALMVMMIGGLKVFQKLGEILGVLDVLASAAAESGVCDQ